MYRAICDYTSAEVRPRLRWIVCTTDFVISVIAAVALVYVSRRFAGTGPKIGDLTTGLIAYAAIVLGFCVAGMTVALTIPDKEFAKRLANKRLEGRPKSAYSDLLFVFSWTAFVHWFLLVSLIAVLLFADVSGSVFPRLKRGLFDGAAACGLTFLAVYCLLHFLITLITLSQVGNRYIESLKETAASEPRST